MNKSGSTSPLRYPGGKAKLYNEVSLMIKRNFRVSPQYVEPFAGGSALSIKLLLAGEVSHVHINDFDHAIWSVWDAILNNTNALIQLIRETPITIEEWHRQKKVYQNQEYHSDLELGFATLFLNRTNRSGILSAGPIGGLKQDGNYLIGCRFNKESIIKLIEVIASNSHKITLYEMDAADFIAAIDHVHNDLFIYLDPPYVQKGSVLYKNSFIEQDHIDLASEVSQLRNKWMMTYDPHSLIKEIYRDYPIVDFRIRYSVDKARIGDEIAIFAHNMDYSTMIKR